MSSALKAPELMTVDEFLEWDSPGPHLWQLIDGLPVAMAPPSPVHGAIQNEAGRLIGNHLIERDSPCQAITTPGVVPRFQPDRNVLIPDLAVTCTASDLAGKVLRRPILIIEILSPSNHAETWRNVWAYMTIPSLREILVIRTVSVGVELLRRGDDGAWPDEPLPIADGDFTLASVDFTLPVTALYRGTGLVAG